MFTDRPDPVQQLRQTREFLQFRSHLPAGEDEQTVQRAARILRAHPRSPLREKVLGLPDDPGDPDAADFSDVTRGLDTWARAIHRRTVSGRHASPPRALPPARPRLGLPPSP